LGRLWPALDIQVPACDPQLRDLVLAELDDFQLLAVQEEEGGAQTGRTETLRAFFPEAALRDAAATALRRAFHSSVDFQAVDLEDEDWAARSQADLQAVTIGRLTIFPNSAAEHGSSNPHSSICLLIPPSMGFGTGHHATTRLMLEALQTVDLADCDVLDVGCGSAILAIAALKLGARRAEAIDVDPDALAAAEDNVRLNGVTGLVDLRCAEISELDGQASIVLANLTGALLERSAAKLADVVRPGGHLMVSGFMASEPTVVPRLEQHLALEKRSQAEEWCCAVFRRR
jgi:ribosomal protein L11 methyltransferase